MVLRVRREERPVIVMALAPAVALADARKIKVTGFALVNVLEEKLPVTPLGSPESVRLTLPVTFVERVTSEDPPARSCTSLGLTVSVAPNSCSLGHHSRHRAASQGRNRRKRTPKEPRLENPVGSERGASGCHGSNLRASGNSRWPLGFTCARRLPF